ncbi:AsnC family transcriptional regulator [Kribbella sp. NBC_01245]|uniref:Lrp/AsnC family transcriptional regulator n=1 Tax=Kribbella sp. NBC_01245 TaxID=2903578 RepID=UPI002E2B7552|nr:AsnC family transcriptional regulator [Kribbella sp. NBC_01245]
MSRYRPWDELDRGLVHALRIDARAPFTRVAAVLGTSTQTVARRYARLRNDSGLRIAGLLYPQGEPWVIRLTAGDAAADVGQALAKRADTSWVRLASGGTEVVAVVHMTPPDLLLRDIPRTAGITAISAHYLLRMYLGGPSAWRGSSRVLTDDQERQLQPPPVDRKPVVLGDADRRLLDVLLEDGRTSYGELAVATGWSAATVAKRLAELRTSGALFFDVQVEADEVATGQALIWLSVQPAELDNVARAIADHDESTVVAATTGRTNLLVNVRCPTPERLHAYLTGRLAFDAIAAAETSPGWEDLKAAGPVRLRTPASVDK